MWSISSLDTCRNFDVNGAKKVVDWKCNLSSSYAQTFSILITSNWSFLDDEAEGFQVKTYLYLVFHDIHDPIVLHSHPFPMLFQRQQYHMHSPL